MAKVIRIDSIPATDRVIGVMTYSEALGTTLTLDESMPDLDLLVVYRALYRLSVSGCNALWSSQGIGPAEREQLQKQLLVEVEGDRTTVTMKQASD